MTNSSSSKKQVQDQPETSEPTLKSLKTKMTKSDEKVRFFFLYSNDFNINPEEKFYLFCF